MMVTSLPFIVRTVQPILEDLGGEYEEAAVTLGATPLQIFRRITMPSVAPALITGAGLAFTRSLGEFGAIIFIAGNLPFETEVTSLLIFVRLQEYNQPAAAAIASVVLGVSLILLALLQWLQGRWLQPSTH
jgi:sulfate transport system permease protein